MDSDDDYLTDNCKRKNNVEELQCFTKTKKVTRIPAKAKVIKIN